MKRIENAEINHKLETEWINNRFNKIFPYNNIYQIEDEEDEETQFQFDPEQWVNDLIEKEDKTKTVEEYDESLQKLKILRDNYKKLLEKQREEKERIEIEITCYETKCFLNKFINKF